MPFPPPLPPLPPLPGLPGGWPAPVLGGDPPGPAPPPPEVPPPPVEPPPPRPPTEPPPPGLGSLGTWTVGSGSGLGRGAGRVATVTVTPPTPTPSELAVPAARMARVLPRPMINRNLLAIRGPVSHLHFLRAPV